MANFFPGTQTRSPPYHRSHTLHSKDCVTPMATPTRLLDHNKTYGCDGFRSRPPVLLRIAAAPAAPGQRFRRGIPPTVVARCSCGSACDTCRVPISVSFASAVTCRDERCPELCPGVCVPEFCHFSVRSYRSSARDQHLTQSGANQLHGRSDGAGHSPLVFTRARLWDA